MEERGEDLRIRATMQWLPGRGDLRFSISEIAGEVAGGQEMKQELSRSAYSDRQ